MFGQLNIVQTNIQNIKICIYTDTLEDKNKREKYSRTVQTQMHSLTLLMEVYDFHVPMHEFMCLTMVKTMAH